MDSFHQQNQIQVRPAHMEVIKLLCSDIFLGLNTFKNVYLLYLTNHLHLKGNRALADLRYGKEDSISPSRPSFAVAKG